VFLHGCSDHQDQLFCLFEFKKLHWPYGYSLGWKIFFSKEINCMSLAVYMVRRGQEMFCGCSRFKIVVRVVYGTAVFIKSVF